MRRAVLLTCALGAWPGLGYGQAEEAGEELDEVYVAELRLPGRLVIGFDFGIGMLDATCGGCYAVGGLSLDGFAGVQVAPRLAILGEVWALNHLIAADDERSGLAIHGIGAAAARVWLDPRLWLQAGAGAGGLIGTGRGGGSTWGPAAMISVGGEPGHKRCSGIDLSLRLGGTIMRDEMSESGTGRILVYNIAAMVGYHWN